MDTPEAIWPWCRGAWALLAALACLATAAGCIPPRSFKQVKTPRSGRPVGKVAVVYSQHYDIRLGGLEKLHPFDIGKFAKIYLKLQTAGDLSPAEVFVPEEIATEDLLRVHTAGYLARLRDPAYVARCLEAPALAAVPRLLVESGLLAPFRRSTGGTLLAARQALACGVGINLGGGYHHAKADGGEGFNIYADMAVAIRALRAEGKINRALVIDLDVHQGNGTAEIFSPESGAADAREVFTFSVHEADIYPIPKSVGDLDVELPPGTEDRTYLAILAEHLPGLFDRARPDIVFLQAGCDTLAGDPLARLRMTPEGIVRRDAMVIDTCVKRGVPVVMVLGGGYSPSAWEAQYASVSRTLATHGGRRRRVPGRKATAAERLYTK